MSEDEQVVPAAYFSRVLKQFYKVVDLGRVRVGVDQDAP